MFSARTYSADKEEIEVPGRRDSSSDRLSTIMESISSQSDYRSRGTDQVPKPAPRRQLLFESKDLHEDVNNILTGYK